MMGNNYLLCTCLEPATMGIPITLLCSCQELASIRKFNVLDAVLLDIVKGILDALLDPMIGMIVALRNSLKKFKR